jgi:hypothetical protein
MSQVASKIEIWNMALSFLGVSNPVSDEDEDSREAYACRLFYNTTLEATFRDYDWPFATKREDLALVETDPNDEWGFSYQYPADAVYLQSILSGERTDDFQSLVRYEIVEDATGKLIYSDQEDAVAKITVMRTDVEFYPSDFVLAVARRLASYIAPMVTGGDPFKREERNFQLYRMEIGNARASAFNEVQPDEEPDSEMIRARE